MIHWPLRTEERLWPDAPGQFGALRRQDIHTGVDFYCERGTSVLAIEEGLVVGVEPFTGAWVQADPSPWWNDTSVVLVQGASGVFAYGEVGAIQVQVGERVQGGQELARIEVAVLRKYKGRPMVMLHLERYQKIPPTGLVWWRQGEEKPSLLLDPDIGLRGMATREFQIQHYDGRRYRAPDS